MKTNATILEGKDYIPVNIAAAPCYIVFPDGADAEMLEDIAQFLVVNLRHAWEINEAILEDMRENEMVDMMIQDIKCGIQDLIMDKRG